MRRGNFKICRKCPRRGNLSQLSTKKIFNLFWIGNIRRGGFFYSYFCSEGFIFCFPWLFSRNMLSVLWEEGLPNYSAHVCVCFSVHHSAFPAIPSPLNSRYLQEMCYTKVPLTDIECSISIVWAHQVLKNFKRGEDGRQIILFFQFCYAKLKTWTLTASQHA